ncbi:armadillo-type protein [Cytidiella melzeri]|nr:armadillo-type protein [Cytidiella melzeri]
MNAQLDRSKRNISKKVIPDLTRETKTHGSETEELASFPSDCYTSSSLVSSTSSSSVNSAVSRSYLATAAERKNRLAPPPTGGTPEWYIKKIHEQTVSTKQLTALQATLQGKDVEWVKRFVELGGMSVLARWLFHANRKSSDPGIEFEVVKCLTYILNHRSATVIALAEGANETITHIVSALDTSHLPTRRLLLDILVFLVYWNDGANYQTVLNGLESLSEDNDEMRNAYAFWFKSLQAVLVGRGKMGSRVGASEQIKRCKGDLNSLLTEYLMSNILLMNGIMQAIADLDVRLHHRSQMETCGLQTIITLARECGIAVIDTQLDLFQQTLEEDEGSFEDRLHQINSCDLTDLGDVCNALRAKIKGSEKAETYLLSIFRHLLLIPRDGQDLVHFLQVVDSVVADVVMDKKLGGAEKRLGLSVERIVGQLEQVERARTAEDELVGIRTAALHLKIEKEALEDRIAQADGLVANLQSEVLKLRLENSRLASTRINTAASPSNSSYTDRLAQLADVLPGSPLALSYVPTSTPRSTASNYKPSVPAGRQPYWGLSSWFGLREDEPGAQAHLPLLPKAGLGITEMKEDLIMTSNISEKAAAAA